MEKECEILMCADHFLNLNPGISKQVLVGSDLGLQVFEKM